MNRPFVLLPALLLAAAPVTALAQARPATVIAGAPQMGARTPALVVVREDARVPRRAVHIPPTDPTPALRLSTPDANEIPAVEVRAKDEWFDDQGLQLKGSKVAFKRRF